MAKIKKKLNKNFLLELRECNFYINKRKKYIYKYKNAFNQKLKNLSLPGKNAMKIHIQRQQLCVILQKK
jgi:hypothetical protein